jgi:Na+/proline symporter
MNAMASSAVSDLYWPIRRNLGLPVDTENSRTPRIAVALMGLVLILFAIVCVFMYDPNGKRSLLDFALGIMAFSASGMLAVFLTALLTTRGNFASVLGALITGAVVVGIFQPAVVLRWSTWLGHPTKLDSQWAMPIGLATSFFVCVMGTPSRKRRHVEAVALHSHAN